MTKKEIGVYIDRTYKVVRQDLINRFNKAGIDITPEQWVILSKLENGKTSQTELASESFKDKPTVSRIIDLLVKKDFVIKVQDPEDGRRSVLSLSVSGKEVVEKARMHVYASREKGWKNLTVHEYEQLKEILDKIFENYSKEEKR